MGSSEQPRGNIIKKAARVLPIPLLTTLAIIGCADVHDIKFPDCSLDHEEKIADGKIIDARIYTSRTILKVDGITFRGSYNRKDIDIFTNQPDRINVIKQNDVYSFNGLQDGRTYVVIFDRESDRTLKNTTIVGTCDNENKLG